MQFSLSIFMLRMNHTNDDIGEFFDEMNDEFETLEDVIKDALEVIDIYEKEIGSSK